ncbi:LOW QUALITY PROTEIN: DBF4-type zinc finger-containing protein 2 [Acanthochromis polyacanthus]|uniref:LOW QUALITY PROTEIN: DBF4-type zinc finger-containing protein 2 n=1 Tax=Acanthochromis polyacanthus TaxID=80966 RepID=UPI002234C34D|nr:LOW QUALITY PROTEIN: DBF4-type zinc finger-containing protein 2 [Acanthochromis polyacanthus]
MSDSSEEDDPRKAEPTSRMWAESQPGPSRCQPSRQGYCGYCRVLYSNLDQHLSSLKHLDSVRSSSRGSSTVSSASSRTKLTLLERFLQDVMQHHPHRYNDPRPSHADLPSVSAPPLPRAELDELRFSDDDSRSRGTREHLPSSDDASCQGANQQPDDGTCSQSGERADQKRLSAPITEQEEGGKRLLQAPPPCSQTPPPQSQTPPPQSKAPPSVHRKAHRKTNRRKTSDSSASSQPHRGPGPDQNPRLQTSSDLRPQTSSDRRLQTSSDPRPQTSSDRRLQTSSDRRLQTSSDRRLQTSSDRRPQTSSDPRPQTSSDRRLQTSSDPRPQTSSDPRPQTSSDRRLQTSSDPRPQTSSDRRLQTSSDPRPQTSSDRRLQTSSDRRPQTSSDPRPQTHLDPRLQTPSDPRPQTHLDPRLQTPSDPRLQTPSDPRLQTPSDPRLQTPSDPRLQTPSDPRHQTHLDPRHQTSSDPRHQTPSDPRPQTHLDPRHQTSSDPRPWLSWQKQRREAQKEEAFSSDHSDLLDQTIEEVIQVFCHGVGSTPCQQEETESFHLSLPVSMETHSDDWDSPVQQVAFQRGHTPADTPVQVGHTGGQELSRLMDVQVDLKDQVYSYQLDSALHSDGRPWGGPRLDQGFWGLPIEEVLPAPERIPESFRGKSWAQIEQEDEEKVDRLVRQFRRGRFLCYFDSESLARYGRRDKKKGRGQYKETEQHSGVLPLLEQDSESVYVRRRRRGRRWSCRLASRCQVVKVSHSTQTVRLVVPAVHQTAEAPPSSIPATNQDAAERTPEAQTWRCLPPSYHNIITPVQPRTSLVYLLCSPSGPTPSCTPAPGSAPKRCRKKRRPLDQQGLKVKYKQLPVRFYEPGTNRILKNPPKGITAPRLRPHCPPPPCVRQLFRSLSPDLNTDRPAGEGSSRVKGHGNGSGFLLGTLSRDSSQTDMVRRRGRTPQALPPSLDSRSERGRGGRRTRPPTSKRRTRAQAMPPQPRREGLRRAGPAPLSSIPPSSRRGRGRRGRR